MLLGASAGSSVVSRLLEVDCMPGSWHGYYEAGAGLGMLQEEDISVDEVEMIGLVSVP